MARSDGGRGAPLGWCYPLESPNAGVVPQPFEPPPPRPWPRLPPLTKEGSFIAVAKGTSWMFAPTVSPGLLSAGYVTDMCTAAKNARGARVPPYFGVYCDSSLAVKILPFILTRAHSLMGWNSTNTVLS